MNRLPAILIAGCLHLCLQASAAELSSPPYWVSEDGTTNALTVVPFLLVTGVDTNTGESIYGAPPAWMLAGPPPAMLRTVQPMQTTTNLVEGVWTNELVEIRIPIGPEQQKFFKPAEVVE